MSVTFPPSVRVSISKRRSYQLNQTEVCSIIIMNLLNGQKLCSQI